MNELFIMTGNKGGVGKSFLSALLADYIIRTAPASLVVSDSEAAGGQSTFWNIMRNDPLVNENSILHWNLGKESGFEEMANAIEQMSDKKIVVDTGASMLAMLAANTDFMTEIQNALDCKITVIFAVGALPDSAVAARQYIKAINATADNKIKSHFVMISPTENNPANFVFYNEEDIQKAIKKLGMTSHFYGTVRQDFFDMTMKELKLPNRVLSDTTIPFGTRTKYSQWVKGDSDNVIGDIIGG